MRMVRMIDPKDLKYHSFVIKFEDLEWEPMETIESWCRLIYPGHPKGCPMVATCTWKKRGPLQEKFKGYRELRIFYVEMELEPYAAKMKEKHPDWSERKCKNLLYWQKTLRKALCEYVWKELGLKWAHSTYLHAEGGGVNFYKTMRKFGIELDLPKALHTVRNIAVVGIKEEWRGWGK